MLDCMIPSTGAARVTAPPVRPVLSAAAASLMLALLLGLQALTTDLYLPALPMLRTLAAQSGGMAVTR